MLPNACSNSEGLRSLHVVSIFTEAEVSILRNGKENQQAAFIWQMASTPRDG